MTRLLALTLLCLAFTAPLRAEVRLYVSPTVMTPGQASWKLPAPTDTDGPLATPGQALTVLEALRRSSPSEPVTIYFRAGTYRLDKTLTLTSAHSGTAQAPVVLRSYPGEKAVFSGAISINGWRQGEGGVFTASLSKKGQARMATQQLFFRGQRQQIARFPNLDPEHPLTGGFLYVDRPGTPKQQGFHYADGEVPLEDWDDLSQAEVNIYPYNCWDHNISPLAEVLPEQRYLRLKYSVAGWINEANRYFLQNIRGALDAPGEWYLDYRTGELAFLPPAGQVADGEVEVPVVENLIRLSGTPEEPVQYVTLQGLGLEGAEQDAVCLEGATHCEIIGNTITNIGGVGVNVGFVRNASKGIGNPWRQRGRTSQPFHAGDRALVTSYPCYECRIAGNDIHSVGGDGIVVRGDGNVADNNHIYSNGLFDKVCAGITLLGNDNIASHSEIHDTPRDGLFINGARNLAEYNLIRHTMLCTVDDGAISLRQHNAELGVRDVGNVLRFNKLIDTVGYGSYPHCTYPPTGYGAPFCTWGVYLDSSICGVTLYGNLIAGSGSNSLFIQFGADNVVENNLFIETGKPMAFYNCMVFFGYFMHSDPEGKYQVGPNQIRRNVLYFTDPARQLYAEGLWGHPEWDPRQVVFEDNLIWHAGAPVEVEMSPTAKFASFEDWQAAGFDIGSRVANPLLLDAEAYDGRLQPDSPAWELGFVDVSDELAKAGVYESPERASWPLENRLLPLEEPVSFSYQKKIRPLVDGFELMKPGEEPATAQTSAEAPASVGASLEAASLGRYSLRFADAPGLLRPWEPHVFYSINLPEGKQRLSVDVMNSPEAPADWYIELREWSGPLLVGPSVAGRSDGTLTVGGRLGTGGKPIATLQPGVWYTLQVDFETGPGALKTFTLRLLEPGQPDQVFEQLPFCDEAFEKPTWLGISSTSEAATVFYLDNLLLGPADSPDFATGRSLTALQAVTQPAAELSPQLGPDKLALWWRFDEPEGEIVLDSSGKGNEGLLAWELRATGTFGSALFCDGTSTLVEAPDRPILNLGTEDFTLELWLAPTQLGVDSQHQRRRVLDKGLYPATWWNLDLLADGRLNLEMVTAGGPGGITYSQGSLPEGAWTHVALVVSRAEGKVRYYLNGKLDSEYELPVDFTGSLDTPGKTFSTGNWQPYIGLLDELKLYRRALSAEEVSQAFEEQASRYTEATFTLSEQF